MNSYNASSKPTKPAATVATAAELLQVDLQACCDAGPPPPDAGHIERWLCAAAAACPPETGSDTGITVRIVDEAESRRLNESFRGIDRPTNVLSFAAQLTALPGLPPVEALHLGDLVLCAPVVAREAREQGKPLADHWAHLLVHGYLHLVGYDHETPAEAAEMERLEARILSAGGVRNPYEEPRPNC